MTAPTHGYVSGDCESPQLNHECSIGCDAGFHLSPNIRKICCTDRGWDARELPICVGKDECRAPVCPSVEILNGNTCDETKVGDECRITCNNGQETDPSVIRCVKRENGECEGKWEPESLPTCESKQHKCKPDITSPENGQTEGQCERAKPDDKCLITCNEGFQLSPNNPTIRCTETGWDSETFPECIQKGCSDLSETNNLIFMDNSNCKPGVPGKRCQFSCEQGYTLDPNINSLLCGNDNEWSNGGRLPQCVKQQKTRCHALNPPKNGDFESPDQCKQPEPKTECTFICNEDYELIGSNSIRCQQNGEWSDNVPVCKRKSKSKCSDLNDIENGFKSGDCGPATSGKSCTFKCNKDFQLIGNANYVCKEDGQWDKPCCPSCKPPTKLKCRPIKNIENGQLSDECGGSDPGGKCVIKCSNGKIHELECLKEGKWDQPVPTCPSKVSKTCKALNPPLNGYLTGKCADGTQESQVCQVVCHTGYVLSGKSDILCGATGDWTPEVPACKPVECPPLNKPQPNGALSGSCSPGVYKQNCQFICPKGFKLSPNIPNVICKSDKTWSRPDITETQLLCVGHGGGGGGGGGVCPPIVKTKYNEISGDCHRPKPDKSCSMQCQLGFQLFGNQTVVCGADGRWVGQQPQCLRECRAISSYGGRHNGYCAPGLEGKTCRLVCDQGYRLVGFGSVLCINGRWSAYPPYCYKNPTIVVSGGALVG